MPRTRRTDNEKFRADCLDCIKYVGPKRSSEMDALNDKQNHLTIHGNQDHRVEIEKTQTRRSVLGNNDEKFINLGQLQNQCPNCGHKLT